MFKLFEMLLDRWIARHGEERTLPGLELNQKQLFWLGAANTWYRFSL